MRDKLDFGANFSEQTSEGLKEFVQTQNPFTLLYVWGFTNVQHKMLHFVFQKANQTLCSWPEGGHSQEKCFGFVCFSGKLCYWRFIKKDQDEHGDCLQCLLTADHGCRLIWSFIIYPVVGGLVYLFLVTWWEELWMYFTMYNIYIWTWLIPHLGNSCVNKFVVLLGIEPKITYSLLPYCSEHNICLKFVSFCWLIKETYV